MPSLRLPVVMLVFGIAGCARTASIGAPMVPSPAGGVSGAINSAPYIQHIVVLVQENRSFDNFFATFPGADAATAGLMKTKHGDVEVPLKKSGLLFDSLSHEHFSFEQEFDRGKMDGFNQVKRALSRGVKVPAGVYAYRYVDPSQIAPYWAIARTYVLGDHMFPTQSSSSFTAHQDLIAGGTPMGNGRNVIDFPTPGSWGCDASKGTVTSLISPIGKYLRDQGPFPCFTYATLRDLLDARGLSWRYFTNPLVHHVWNAFDAISAVRYGPEWNTNIVTPETLIFKTIHANALPAVTWVIPDAVNSDHPGKRSDTGPSWVADIVNAIGQSPYWQSTAIVVVWDDWGGEYDNVAPPQIDGQGLGMRVPMLLVSAYARKTSPSQFSYISHTQYEFGSIVRFIEDNWSLGRLGTSDIRSNSLIDCFDFTQAPRPFAAISVKYPISFFEHQKPSGLPLDDE